MFDLRADAAFVSICACQCFRKDCLGKENKLGRIVNGIGRAESIDEFFTDRKGTAVPLFVGRMVILIYSRVDRFFGISVRYHKKKTHAEIRKKYEQCGAKGGKARNAFFRSIRKRQNTLCRKKIAKNDAKRKKMSAEQGCGLNSAQKGSLRQIQHDPRKAEAPKRKNDLGDREKERA